MWRFNTPSGHKIDLLTGRGRNGARQRDIRFSNRLSLKGLPSPLAGEGPGMKGLRREGHRWTDNSLPNSAVPVRLSTNTTWPWFNVIFLDRERYIRPFAEHPNHPVQRPSWRRDRPTSPHHARGAGAAGPATKTPPLSAKLSQRPVLDDSSRPRAGASVPSRRKGSAAGPHPCSWELGRRPAVALTLRNTRLFRVLAARRHSGPPTCPSVGGGGHRAAPFLNANRKIFVIIMCL